MFRAGDDTYTDEVEALYALQNLLLKRGEGQLGPTEDQKYINLRRGLMKLERYQKALPVLVKDSSDLGAAWPILRDVSGQWEGRRQFVREQMRAAMNVAMSADGPPEYTDNAENAGNDSSRWTGIVSGRERLRAARSLIPFARASIEGLLAELERPTGNGGPPMDEKLEAIDSLRKLHAALGSVLTAIEEGGLEDVRGSDLASEAARYAARAARALRNDPMPYLVSGGVAAILGLLGFGALGGFISGVAMTFKKNAGQ